MENKNIQIIVGNTSMPLCERVAQYTVNIFGIYNTSKSVQDLEIMLENFKDYNVDSNEEELLEQLKKIFDLPNFNSHAIQHLISEQVEKFLIKTYVNS